MNKNILFRVPQEKDRTVYTRLMETFYNTDAVLSPLPKDYYSLIFDEILKEGPLFKGYLFEYDGKTAGFGQLSFRFSSEAGGLECWIEDLFVKEEYQGLGIGSAFFDFVLEAFPCSRYRLEVEEENNRAIALYQKKNFHFLPYRQMILDRKEESNE